MNVLPYLIGVELGYEWEQQTTRLNLTGNLAQYEARAVVVQNAIASDGECDRAFDVYTEKFIRDYTISPVL